MTPELGFGLDSHAAPLMDLFLRNLRNWSAELDPFAASARALNGESWAVRRLAALLLENIVWRHSANALAGLPGLLGECPQEPRKFITSLQARIARLARIHAPILCPEPPAKAWPDFFHVARQDCKLTLGQWLFSPDDVMQEIASRVTITCGTADRTPAIVPMHRWSGSDKPELPTYEAQLVDSLTREHKIYWVTPLAGSELNSLVEYPLQSAALVIKPPGSDLEIQIKRSGLRGPRPLDVVFERRGEEVPSSHRLHGGSFGWLAKREARAASLFAKIYRAVHSELCPCNETVAISSVAEVPSARGPVHILDYLSERDLFGDGYDALRRAMRQTAAALPPDTAVKSPAYEGRLGDTLQFITQAVPQQAIQIHTTSYRLERVLAWLTEEGARTFFAGAGKPFAIEDARRFANDVMDEILGGLAPAQGEPCTYTQYVDALFEIPENRARADARYLSLMGQTGKVWGTLLGVRGYTDGESFVIRNSGIRAVWTGHEWDVHARFMDHDDLVILGRDRQHFWPSRSLLGMSWDELHIVGGENDGVRVRGIAGALKTIYRIDEDFAQAAIEALRHNAKLAYAKTLAAVEGDSQVRNLFSESFSRGIRDLDAVIERFLEIGDTHAWRAETRSFLTARNYSPDLIDDYLRGVRQRAGFLRKMRFLFTGSDTAV